MCVGVSVCTQSVHKKEKGYLYLSRVMRKTGKVA